MPKFDAVKINNTDGSKVDPRRTLTRGTILAPLQPITSSVLGRPYDFARTMDAYMLLNDLLAGDTPVPCVGCFRSFQIQLNYLWP